MRNEQPCRLWEYGSFELTPQAGRRTFAQRESIVDHPDSTRRRRRQWKFPMPTQAKEFVILRDVVSGSRIHLDLPREPLHVCTLLNEEAFNDGHVLVHCRTVFWEDRMHDWDWRDGKFSYYTRTAERADVVVVYEAAEYVPKMNFDPETGEPLRPGLRRPE